MTVYKFECFGKGYGGEGVCTIHLKDSGTAPDVSVSFVGNEKSSWKFDLDRGDAKKLAEALQFLLGK